MKDFETVNDWIKHHFNSIVKSFYATAIMKATGIPLVQVQSELEKFVSDGILEINHQVICDNGHTIANNVDITKVSIETPLTFECIFCQEEIEIFNPRQLQKQYIFTRQN